MLEADSEITDIFTIWIEFIKNPISSNLKQMEMTVEGIREAKEELFRISSNEKERMLYEDRKASLLDKVSALENAERKGSQNHITQSMSKAGYPYDNAPMEHCFNTLKRELINQHYYHNDQELNDDIYDYAYVWYNHLRPHTFNNGLTPFEARFKNN